MRKTILGLALLGLLMFGMPAASGTHGATFPHTHGSFTFQGAVPCATACAYWVDALGFSECDEPFPPGSYVDRTINIPAGYDTLFVELFPQVDWDGFICAPNNGKTLAQMANILGDNCDNIIGPQNPVPAGCYEQATVAIPSGLNSVVFRVYNWSDGAPVVGKWWVGDLK